MTLQQVKEGARKALTNGRGEECAPWNLVIAHSLKGNTRAERHHEMESRIADDPK